MKKKFVEIITHPSVANVGPFFDIAGFCTNINGDRTKMRLFEKKNKDDEDVIISKFNHNYRDGIDKN